MEGPAVLSAGFTDKNSDKLLGRSGPSTVWCRFDEDEHDIFHRHKLRY